MILNLDEAIDKLGQEMQVSLKKIKPQYSKEQFMGAHHTVATARVGSSTTLYGFMCLITDNKDRVQSTAYRGRYEGKTGSYDSYSGITSGMLNFEIDMHEFPNPIAPRLVRTDFHNVPFLGMVRSGPAGIPVGTTSSRPYNGRSRAMAKIYSQVRSYSHKIPLSLRP